jgi:hypothetical protein
MSSRCVVLCLCGLAPSLRRLQPSPRLSYTLSLVSRRRCHRIGQTKDVKIYRLVTSRSFEQEMFDRASRKLGLEQAVLGTFEQGNDADKPTHEEMEQLLKRGAYALLDDEHDQVTQEFCTDDIDAILRKRTRTRVVEGAKTASWLNKSGMMVTKSKFTSEDGEQIDVTDPLFWSKIMPSFVTPSILLKKLGDLADELEGSSSKPKGPGRGRWRKKLEEATKKPDELDSVKSTAAPDAEETDMQPSPGGVDAGKDNNMDDQYLEKVKELQTDETLDDLSDLEEDRSPKTFELSKVQVRKIQKFIGDVKSMMDSLLEEADDEGLSLEDKDVCQRLLFTISVKEKIFSEEQRRFARLYLKRLEGDRKRRCRTSEASRFAPGVDETGRAVGTIPDHLMFKEKKRRRRRKRNAEGELVDFDDEPVQAVEVMQKPRASTGGAYVGDDGYLHHSDSEEAWSDVGEDPYTTATKKERITRKEAGRRRRWAHDDDALTAAGRPWPVIPRQFVNSLLTTVIDEVLKYDAESGGGIFSVAVPKDDFPDYYEQIKQPMDYGEIKKKLANGQYRSAQAMQKDFILILQNCRQYNAPTSDIVKEARKQHLMRPKILTQAAEANKLFLAEDGSVFEIVDDEPKGEPTKKKAAKKEDSAGANKKPAVETESQLKAPKSNGAKSAATKSSKNQADAEGKPRIKIRVGDKEAKSVKSDKGGAQPKAAKRKRGDDKIDQVVEHAPESAQLPAKKKQRKAAPKAAATTAAKDDVTIEIELPAAETMTPSLSQADKLYLDIAQWKSERESLDGSFDAARALFTMYGPWKLPSSVGDDGFAEVAKATLTKMGR